MNLVYVWLLKIRWDLVFILLKSIDILNDVAKPMSFTMILKIAYIL